MQFIKYQVDDKLWSRHKRVGPRTRAYLANLLGEKFGTKISQTVQIYEPTHQWHFKNIYKTDSFIPSFQTTKNNHPRAGVEDVELTLLDIDNGIAGGVPVHELFSGADTMNADRTPDTPKRLKIIIMSCQKSDANMGGRRRIRRKRRSKIRRKKKTKRRKKKIKKKKKKKMYKKKDVQEEKNIYIF